MRETTRAGSRYRRWSPGVKAVLAAAVLCGAAASGAVWAAQTESDDDLQEASWISGNGLYRLSFSSSLHPIQINKLHNWTIRLETMDGQAVTQAEIDVTGGMPIHDHGLPTRPAVTRELGNGGYLLEGMRFHMSGYWEIVMSINAAAGSDTVVVKLNI